MTDRSHGNSHLKIVRSLASGKGQADHLKRSYLENLRSLDAQAFSALMRHLGFDLSACYILKNQTWTLALASKPVKSSINHEKNTESEYLWPPAVSHIFNYTPDDQEGLPLGWAKNITSVPPRDHWPKGVNFYFPEQLTFDLKLVFIATCVPGKRIRTGDLSADLEVVASRLRGIFLRDEKRSVVNEATFAEHVEALGTDLRRMIDHELRTPMASVAGYATLLTELDPEQQRETWAEYRQIMQHHTEHALTMLDKLSLSLQSNTAGSNAPPMEEVDAAPLIQELCRRMAIEAPTIIGSDAAKRTTMHFHKNTDQDCLMQANRRLLTWSIWEVLKNAIIHAKNGRVDVTLYTSDDRIVLDIKDDGDGVAPGSEDLIFLRFYQDTSSPAARKGRRGLGLGLFLARRIAERHLGNLIYTRLNGRTGVFRFLWPLLEEKDEHRDMEGRQNERKGA